MSLIIQPDCNIMRQFATSIELKISIIINLIISIIAIPILVKSMIYIMSKNIFHVNTRLQIQVHLFALILHSVGRIFLHSIDLYNYMRDWDSACEILPNFYRCLVLRGFYNVGLALSSMCSISLVFERIASTVYSNSYEHCKTHWGIALVCLQFVLASIYLTSIYFHAAFQPGNFVLYYCTTIASSSGSIFYVVVPLYSVLVAQIFSRILFEILIRKSKQLRAVQDISLSSRYNLDQGIGSITSLKTLIDCTTVVFAILSLVTTTLHLNAANLTRQRYIALVEAVHILPSYGIVISIIMNSKLNNINKTKKKQLLESITADPNLYFQQFQDQLK